MSGGRGTARMGVRDEPQDVERSSRGSPTGACLQPHHDLGAGRARCREHLTVFRRDWPAPTSRPHPREVVVLHRPRVYGEHHVGSMFRRPGWFWRFQCGCGYKAPFWMLMTWPVAVKYANTHVWAARAWERRIEDEVVKFRRQLDAR